MPTLTFLGAAGTVTGSKHLLDLDGRLVLVDCGLFQGLKELRERNWAALPVDPRRIDAVVLTHAHLDHCGYLPRLVGGGFRGRIFCTPGTKDLCTLILPDSAHIQEEDARQANRHGYSKHEPALPLYTAADAARTLTQLQPVGYDRPVPVVPGVEVEFINAGHLLGSAYARFRIGDKTLLFGGDLGRYGRPVLPDPMPVESADVLLLESTYGDRLHPPDDGGARLAEIINQTVKRGGRIIIPSFAVGRVEELLYWLRMLEQTNRIPRLPVYVDSPMAAGALQFYSERVNELDPGMKPTERDVAVFGTSRMTIVASAAESAALVASRTPAIVIAASGMATGGRVLNHLFAGLPDPNNTVLFVGYQSEGTRGRRLLDGARQVKIQGQLVPVAAHIERLDWMSAHADAAEILQWLSGFVRPPAITYLVHGESAALEALRARIEAERGWPVRSRNTSKRWCCPWGRPERRTDSVRVGRTMTGVSYAERHTMTKRVLALMTVIGTIACGDGGGAVGCSFALPSTSRTPPPAATGASTDRKYLLERVDEAAVVQLYADAFRDLTLKDKTLVWHLYQAAIAGRDIFYDQKYLHNLDMRDVLEAIITHPAGVDPKTLAEITRYTKLFWLNTGPYNNLTARKFVLQCTPDVLAAAAHAAEKGGAAFPLANGETLDQLLTRLEPAFFDPNVDPTITAKTPPVGKDILTASANNLYVGVTMKDLTGFVERFPLNSRLVKTNGKLVEEVYRIDGRYGKQIAAIVRHLEAAIPYATEPMQKALRALITFYRTGDTSDREAYDIAWVQDKASPVDTMNGFIEVYLDARGIKGAYQALVFYVNKEKTSEIQKIAQHAQWFEDHMPWDPAYRKPGVQGITANAIDVVIETGDSGPVTPVGINLPNDQAIRERYGSKSVSLSNVSEAYDKSTLPEFRSEFSWTPGEIARAMKWSAFAGDLTTNMHEVIGHASGKVEERLKGNPAALLKEQFSALEEGRADLVALYFLPDPKLAEIGILAAADQDEIVRTEYEAYARNALVQLRRVREGTQIEEDHMRNRQMVVRWLIANTKAIEVNTRDGKTYHVVTDPKAFRDGVGRLLAEVQRIKAQGDYPAAKLLFETYGVHFDPKLRDEVVARVQKLNLPSYTGFVMPKLDVSKNASGEVTDVAISYPMDFMKQMLDYAAATRDLR